MTRGGGRRRSAGEAPARPAAPATGPPAVVRRRRPEGEDLDVDMTDESRRPSEIMRALGIRQAGEPVLSEPTVPFRLPRESEDVARIIARLLDKATLVAAAHRFELGLGLAAPQLGVARSAAVVLPSAGSSVVLVNPRVIDGSDGCVSDYECCASFLDVRGLVPRPTFVVVEHLGMDGRRRRTTFHSGLARLVAHEIDHLNGVLYDARMRLGSRPVPIGQEPHRLADRPGC